MKFVVFLVLALFCCGSNASAASGELLFSYSGTFVSGGVRGEFDYLVLPVQSTVPDLGYAGPQLFADQHWTPADVGQTVTITYGAGGSDFREFTNALTDGVEESLSFWQEDFTTASAIPEQSGYTVVEPWVIFGSQYDPRIDLHGDFINAVAETLDEFSTTAIPGGAGYQYEITLSAYGAGFVVGSPEPASGMLSAASGLCLIARRGRRFRKPQLVVGNRPLTTLQLSQFIDKW